MKFFIWIKKLFEETNGEPSSIRVMSFSVIATFLYDWIHTILANKPFTPDWAIVGIVIGILGVKSVQKFAEIKGDSNKSIELK
jgi:hypothetical protein